MDISTIVSLIGSLGFPIVCCIIMFYQNNTINKNFNSALNTLQDNFNNALNSIKESFDESIRVISETNSQNIIKMNEALNNNTIALTKLSDKLGVEG